jgi:predicted secreted protein
MTGRRWIALVVLVALGIGLLVAIVAIPWDDDATTSSSTIYHEGDDIIVDQGDEFVIALAANPTTGYEWTAADDPDVTFVSSKQLTSSTLPGAGGTQELTFRAEHPGSSTLELNDARSFEQGVPPAKTAKFPVTVKKLNQ